MKTQTSRISLFCGIVLSFFGLQSCEKCDNPCNAECENYDPCCGKTPASASFKIYEVIGASDEIRNNFELSDLATDTIVYTNFALFKADSEADYYEWSVGNDPRVWNTREFTLRFGKPHYTPIKVTLKVFKKDDESCFSNVPDTSIFTRSLYTAPKEDSKTLGRYEGRLGREPNRDNFFELSPVKNRFNETGYSISGIAPNCSTNKFDNSSLKVFVGYRSFYITTAGTKIGCCYGLSASGVVNDQNELTMDLGYYSFENTDSCSWDVFNDQYITDTFKGKKI
jgi:hypothetical protein